jgi:hypothetical protein
MRLYKATVTPRSDIVVITEKSLNPEHKIASGWKSGQKIKVSSYEEVEAWLEGFSDEEYKKTRIRRWKISRRKRKKRSRQWHRTHTIHH